MEDFAYILDFMPQGHSNSKRFDKEPIAYAIGEGSFTLLELGVKHEESVQIGERVYVGKELEKRQQVKHIKGRVDFAHLSTTAQKEMPYVIEDIIRNNEMWFIQFFNEARPITTRMHMLELLPGLGKKSMWSIIDERKKKSFESFDDLKERVKSLRQPEKLVASRIALEIEHTDEKYKLFIQP